MLMLTMIVYLEHALLNLMQSVKVEEKTSDMMQLFTTDFHLILIMKIILMMVIILIILRRTILILAMTSNMVI